MGQSLVREPLRANEGEILICIECTEYRLENRTGFSEEVLLRSACSGIAL
jgi:hypothetical protein